MNLTAEQIEQNYLELLEVINTEISEPRKSQLLELYDQLATRIAAAPASSVNTLHGAYAGGYVVHVLNVIKCAKQMYGIWKASGAFLDDYTFEELMFSVINHDLGKVGDMDHEYYIPNTSEWHVKNQGKVYTDNPLINNLAIPDRSLWMLQHNGISVTQNEFLAIKLHDGPFMVENQGYFNTFQEHKKFKTNIVFVIHFSDMMATRIEFENERAYRNENPSVAKPTNFSKPKGAKQITGASDNAMAIFDKMFNIKE